MDNALNIENKDQGKQCTISMSTTTYHIIMNNIVSIGENVGLKMIKPVDVDSSGNALKSQYESQLIVNEVVVASITISCYHTTNNILVQLKGKKVNDWDKKLETLHHFVHVTLKSVIMRVEMDENYINIKENIREALTKMQDSGDGEGRKVMQLAIQCMELIPLGSDANDTPTEKSANHAFDHGCEGRVDQHLPTTEGQMPIGIAQPTKTVSESASTIIETNIISELLSQTPSVSCPDTIGIPPKLNEISPELNEDISAETVQGKIDCNKKEPEDIEVLASPVIKKPSPLKSPNRRCNKACFQRISSLENEKKVLSQQIQTLETHQLTLRSTIVIKDETLEAQAKVIDDMSKKTEAQKKVISEQDLMIHVHENVAVTYMDMIVTGEDTLDIEESEDNKLHAQLREMFNVVQNLRQEIKQLKDDAEAEKSRFCDLKEKHQAGIQELEKCQQNLKENKSKFAMKNKEYNALIKEVANCEQIRSTQDEKISSLTDDLCLKHEMAIDAQNECKQLIDKCQSLENINNELYQEIEGLKGKTNSDDLNKQLQNMVRKKMK